MMTKEEFQARAKQFAASISMSKKEELEVQDKDVEARRAAHILDIKQFDSTAAAVEQKFFDADDARANAERALCEYYASKVEK